MSHQELSFEVVRVRTKQTLCRPEIAQLVLRGAWECGFPTPAAILAELCRNPGDESLGIFVGTGQEVPCALAIAQLPVWAFMLEPMVLLAYSERAPSGLVTLVGQRLREWIVANGFATALALNMRHGDRAFCRGLAHFGAPTRAGGVIAFALTPGSGEAT